MSQPRTTELKTVKIQSEGGFTVINESDYDEKVHKLFKDKNDSEEETPEINEKFLNKQNKDSLLALAGERKLEIKEGATNKEIADAILEFEEKQKEPKE